MYKSTFVFKLTVSMSFVVLCLAILLLDTKQVKAASDYYPPIEVEIDGDRLYFNHQSAIFKDGYTMVPIREIFEELGSSIQWDQPSKTVTATKGDTTIKIIVGQNTAVINEKTISLSKSAEVINGTTLVPLRFISEAFGANVYWYNQIGTVVIVTHKKQAPVVTLNPGDYEIEFLPKERVEELSSEYSYYYHLYLHDYIEENYPNTVNTSFFSYTNLERMKGFTEEDKLSEYKFPIPRSISNPSIASRYDKNKEIDNEIDYYINLYDDKNQYITTLHIDIEVPLEYIANGYTIKEMEDFTPLKGYTSKLNDIKFDPIVSWDYAVYDNYRSDHNRRYQSSYKHDISFQQDFNYYMAYYSTNTVSNHERTIKLDFLKGLDVGINILYKKKRGYIEQYIERINIDDMKAEDEIILDLNPEKTDSVLISIDVYNPVNFTRAFYTIELIQLPLLHELFHFETNHFFTAELLPNDRLEIEIPGSLTTTGKKITIKEKAKSFGYYYFKDYMKGASLKSSDVKGNIKVKLIRGSKVVYDTSYIYNTYPIPIINTSKYKIDVQQFDQSRLMQEKLVSGYPNMFAGTVDLSSIPNVAFASNAYHYNANAPANSYMFGHTMDPANEVHYDYGWLITLKGDEKYSLDKNQKVHFILFDKNRYPLGILTVDITLKEGYIHKQAKLK